MYALKPTIEEAEGALKGLNKYVVVQVSVLTEYSRIDWLHAATVTTQKSAPTPLFTPHPNLSPFHANYYYTTDI
jgi:hypothetical protein